MDANASSRPRAAAYARVSTVEQVDGTSLATQTERCRSYIKSQGWSLAGEFADEGVSGAKAIRPALEKLLAVMRSGQIDIIVVAKLDRLGRSMRHLVVLLAELDDRNVRLVSVAESFDSQNAAGRLQRNILGSFAEYEREQIRERTSSGQLATVREGFWPGGPPPYGWRLARDGRHTRVELDKSEASILRSAAEMVVVEGLSMTQVARRLNAVGQRSRKGRPWNRTSLRWALSGPLAGEWQWHYAATEGSRRRPGEGVAVVNGPEIIPSTLREALDRRLAATESGQRREWYPYLLSGRFQSACGDQYIGAHTPKQGAGYRCRRQGRSVLYGEPRCDCRRIPVELVEPLVWGGLAELLSDAGRLEALAEKWLNKASALAGVETESLGAIERRIARLEANLARSLADCLRHDVLGNAMRLATAEVTSEIEQLRAYRDRLVTAARYRATAGSQIDELVQTAREALNEATPERRRRIASLLGLQAQLLGWSLCSGCHGSGKATGLGVGARCPVCFGARALPVLQVTGEVDLAVLRPQGDTASTPLPFALELRTVV